MKVLRAPHIEGPCAWFSAVFSFLVIFFFFKKDTLYFHFAMESANYVASSHWGWWPQYLHVVVPCDLGFLTAWQLGSKFESFETESHSLADFHSFREPF